MPADSGAPPVLQGLLDSMPNALSALAWDGGQPRARIEAARLLEGLRCARDKAGLDLDRLVDLFARTHGSDAPAVVYLLDSTRHGHRLTLEASAPEVEGRRVLDSAVPLFPEALWLEREAFEAAGIHFDGHAELRPQPEPADPGGGAQP